MCDYRWICPCCGESIHWNAGSEYDPIEYEDTICLYCFDELESERATEAAANKGYTTND